MPFGADVILDLTMPDRGVGSDSLVRRRIIVPTRRSEMSAFTILQTLKESILSQANVKAIYGDPITAHGKTVIPVAKIMYGFGAGAGTGGVGDTRARGDGRGGGRWSRGIAGLERTAMNPWTIH